MNFDNQNLTTKIGKVMQLAGSRVEKWHLIEQALETVAHHSRRRAGLDD